MGRKFGICLFLCTLILSSFSFPVGAQTVPYFTFSLSAESVCENQLIKLQINANEMPDTAAGFRMIVGYDDKILRFVGAETSTQIKSGTMVTNNGSNPIYSVYVCNVDKSSAPVLSGNIISFVFQVKDEAPLGKTTINACIDQVCNYQAQQLNLNYNQNLTFPVVKAESDSGQALLSGLVPGIGELSPPFSPNVFAYTMEVNSDVNSVEFMASAVDGGTVRINRKTLGKAGSETMIVASVTSADKKSVAQYVVTVHRKTEIKESPSSAEPSSAAITGTTAGTSGKGNNPGKGQSTVQSEAYAQGGTVGSSSATHADQPAGKSGAASGNILIMGNQMPEYLILMLICSQCVLIGIGLSIWLKLNPKKQK